jgi:hypothetical protein
MAEQDDQPASDGDAKGVADRIDRVVSPWLRDLTALAGLIAVVIGSVVSVMSLRDKAQDELRTAGLEFQKAQQQTLQHQQDLNQQLQIHSADLQHQEHAAASQDAKDKDQRLADVIGRIFTDKGSSEGDLAVLFEFLNDDKGSQEIIQNAVLARLEDPRSRAEIDLGFRLLERMGPSAVSQVIEVNRSARRQYDDCLYERFSRQVKSLSGREQPVVGSAINGAQNPKDAAELSVSGISGIDKGYEFATINRMWTQGAPGRFRTAERTDAQLVSDQDLAAEQIARSNLVLRSFIAQHPREIPRTMNLSGTYLENGTVFDPYKGLIGPIRNAYLNETYLSGVGASALQGALFRRIEYVRTARAPQVLTGIGCRGQSPSNCTFAFIAPEAP